MLTAIRHKALLALGCMLLAVVMGACTGETSLQGETGSSGPQGVAGEIDRTVPTAEQGLNGNT